MKLTPDSSARVTYPQLKWTCACLALALLAQVGALPLWLLGVVCALAALRLILAARGRRAPPQALRLLIAAASIALLFVQFRTFNGLAAGTALLSLMAGLKLLETRTLRDVRVIALIVYFLSLAALLRAESFWLLGYLVGVCWLTTATLLRLRNSAVLPAWRASLNHSGRLLRQALPIAAILWLLFPRFDGPLWPMPEDRRGAETGLSDSMSPGDITELALSDDIAFRVHFISATPSPGERYWRGPVLHDFDGRTWRRLGPRTMQDSGLRPVAGAYEYTLSLEPHQHNWIFALDWPTRWDLPQVRMTSDFMLVQMGPVSKPIDVRATSYSRVQSSAPLSAATRRRDTQLPIGRNQRTVQLSQQLRREHPEDMDYVAAVLALFRHEQFFYTLTPPSLGRESVDEFLFDTKRGFCGHYASAFATLMRAAGIPARVVTGYQGGTFNRFADYWILRQSDAHAWDEIWIEGRGWLRVDPTSAVAPWRVEQGSGDVFAANEPLVRRWQRHAPWLADMRLRLDALQQLWRERILRFDHNSQNDLLVLLRIPEPDAQKLVMVLAGAITLALAWLTWQVRRELQPPVKDPLIRAYARLCRKLAAAGLARRPHEGAEAFGARIAALRPELAATITDLCRRYTQLRYGADRANDLQASFISAVRDFHPRRTARTDGSTGQAPTA